MQISRLFKIIYLLQEKKKMTARELAEYFEVSTRTILRDVDTLSIAGIPIYTSKGRGGGIFIMEHFVLDKAFISKEEQDRILFALQNLDSVEPTDNRELLSKMQTFFQNSNPMWLEVDFTRWGSKAVEKEKFTLLKSAILQHMAIEFSYTSTYGETIARRVKPLRLVFKYNTWYLQGYCMLRKDYRIFKINRMRDIRYTNEGFEGEEFETISLDMWEGLPPKLHKVTVEYTKESAYNAYDSFSQDKIKRNADGSATAADYIILDTSFYDYILSLGTGVTLISPKFARKELIKRINMLRDKYK